MNQKFNKTFKIIIEGARNPGKTQLFCELLNKNYNEAEIGPELGIEIVQYQNINYKLQIWDTHRQYNHMKLATMHYKGTHVVLIVFDVGNIETFNLCSMYIEQIRSNCHQNTQIMLVGQQFNYIRQVRIDEPILLAEMNNITYTEINYLEDTQQAIILLKQRITALAITNEYQ
ncbi:Rab1a [Hexamita inflata]|uniref:Rab1a n=1 Tax=Hexamita inflata TaxID=28002 RepID=A0AA86R213_9EUKA|nr:Rab1a [Hexamita inflata]